MQPAVPGVVGFDDKQRPELAFKTDVSLITFRDAQIRIEPAREAGVENAKLPDDG